MQVLQWEWEMGERDGRIWHTQACTGAELRVRFHRTRNVLGAMEALEAQCALRRHAR
jgi:hypothetical protein